MADGHACLRINHSLMAAISDNYNFLLTENDQLMVVIINTRNILHRDRIGPDSNVLFKYFIQAVCRTNAYYD